jgi:Ca2+-transporting ATPase
MLAVTGCTILAQVLIIQFAWEVFNTVPLTLNIWLKLFAVTASVVLVSEVVKAVVNVISVKK